MFVTLRFIAKTLLTVYAVSFTTHAHASAGASIQEIGYTAQQKSSSSNKLDFSLTDPPYTAARIEMDGEYGILKAVASGNLYEHKLLSYTYYTTTGITAAGSLLETVTFDYSDVEANPLYATLYYSIGGKFSDRYIYEDGTASGQIRQAPSDAVQYTRGIGGFSITAYTEPEHPFGWSIGFASNPESKNQACRSTVECVVGYQPGHMERSLTLPLSRTPYTIATTLYVYAGGVKSDFSETAKLFLSVPEGVTFTSGSGTFLSKATPISAVPLPSACLFMLSGVSVLFLRRRSRQAGIN